MTSVDGDGGDEWPVVNSLLPVEVSVTGGSFDFLLASTTVDLSIESM